MNISDSERIKEFISLIIVGCLFPFFMPVPNNFRRRDTPIVINCYTISFNRYLNEVILKTLNRRSELFYQMQ